VDDFEDDLQSLTTEMKGNSLVNHHPSQESGLSDQEQVSDNVLLLLPIVSSIIMT